VEAQLAEHSHGKREVAGSKPAHGTTPNGETMPKIKTLDTTPMDIMVMLAEGNPGAASVLGKMFNQGEAIDPDSALGGMSGLFALDTLGIYGSHIWVLYKDICGQNLVRMLGLLRANQLGFLSNADLKSAVHALPADRALDVDALLAKVKEQLPRFGEDYPWLTT
jgi:hypothetical protein